MIPSPAEKPLAGQSPEFDPSVFILKSGVGTRPVPPPPAEKTSDGEPQMPEKKPVVKDSPKKAEEPKPETKKRASSLWFKGKPAPAPAPAPQSLQKPVVPAQKPSGQSNGLNVPVSR